MAEEATAQAYAQAIFDKAVERYARELQALVGALERHGLVTQLDSPTETFERKKEWVNSALPPQVDPEVRNLALMLASKNLMHLLPDVIANFERLSVRGSAAKLALVTSAVELTAEERSQLETKLRKQYGQELLLDYRVDPALLGGVVVRIGDHVIDGSVAGKLAAMRQKLEVVR